MTKRCQMAAILIDGIVWLISQCFGDQINQTNQLSNRQRNPSNSSSVYFRDCFETTQHSLSELQQKGCQIFYTTTIRNGTAANLALDTRRENVR